VEEIATSLGLNIVVLPANNPVDVNVSISPTVWVSWNSQASPRVLKLMLKRILKSSGICIDELDGHNWVGVPCISKEKWVWIKVKNPWAVNSQLTSAGIKNYIIGKGIYIPKRYAYLVTKADFKRHKYRIVVLIGEVSIDILTQLGVNLKSEGSQFSPTTLILSTWPKFKELVIGMFKDRTKGTIVSMPSLYVAEGGESSWEDGGEIRYLDRNITLVDTSNLVDREEAIWKKEKIGFELKIKAGIEEKNGSLPLSLELKDRKVVALSPLQLATRALRSTVWLKDSQPVILVGLGRKFSTYRTVGVPLLSKIPVIGALFRYKEVQKERKALVIALWYKKVE
jgi:hypothetical protein